MKLKDLVTHEQRRLNLFRYPTHDIETYLGRGETGRNGFTRGGEHLANKLVEDKNKSVLKLHANHQHNGADVRFSMRVTGVHNDSLDRQVRRGSTLPTLEENF